MAEFITTESVRVRSPRSLAKSNLSKGNHSGSHAPSCTPGSNNALGETYTELPGRCSRLELGSSAL